ncbi:hypothetical protein RirG_243790 [Rhizophagus irregularis DAOM 197198w]|nr:hypothetical protein RirG_243790 [Rhizophagus irregularis DAOM 197198w]
MRIYWSFGCLKLQFLDMEGGLVGTSSLVPSTPLTPLTPTGLSFSSQTELNDFGASSQAKLTPSARFISSVRHGLDLTTLGLRVQIG